MESRCAGRSELGVTIGRTSDVTTLNPVLYGDLPTGEVVNRLFDHLVLTDRNQRFVPGRLVERWETSEDGLTWDFHLRRGARWHDGRPVTAEDACFTFDTMLDPGTASPRRAEFLVDGDPISYAALASRRLRITLPAPFAPLLAALAWRPIIPRHVFAAGRARDNRRNREPIGSGPFVFESWRAGAEVSMRAWSSYHLGPPAIGRVSWRCMPECSDVEAALIDGGIDYVTDVPARVARRVEGAEGIRVVRSLDGSFVYLGFRAGCPAFRDIRVRQAIDAAVDRRRMVSDVLLGEGQVADSPIVQSDPWHNPSVRAAGHDPRLARELLDAAGWLEDADGMRADRTGRALRFTLLTVASDAVKLGAAELIARDLGAVGIQVSIEAHPIGDLLQRHVFPGRFDAVLLGHTPGPDPSFLHAFYHSAMTPPGGWNLLRYASADVDRLLEASQRAIEPAARRALIDRVQARIGEDLPHVLMFHPVAVDAAGPRLSMPPLPAAHANRFMYLHRWKAVEAMDRADPYPTRASM
jgi:peptide/nickel transport system substrate-binding protein